MAALSGVPQGSVRSSYATNLPTIACSAYFFSVAPEQKVVVGPHWAANIFVVL